MASTHLTVQSTLYHHHSLQLIKLQPICGTLCRGTLTTVASTLLTVPSTLYHHHSRQFNKYAIAVSSCKCVHPCCFETSAIADWLQTLEQSLQIPLLWCCSVPPVIRPVLANSKFFRQILSYYSATTDALFQSIKFYSLLNWKYLPYSIVCIHNGIASWRCISYFSAVCLSAAFLLLFSKLCCTVHYFCLKVCAFTWAPFMLGCLWRWALKIVCMFAGTFSFLCNNFKAT